MTNSTLNKIKHHTQRVGIYVVSALGAIGVGLQNYMAMVSFGKTVLNSINTIFAASKGGLALLHGIPLAFGGMCSGLVNLCINIGLIEDFLVRITKKKKPELEGFARFRYWAGSSIFVVTGILFGLTAFAFGPIGPLMALSIAAGIFVSAIMIIQELETWLASFDLAEGEKRKSLKEMLIIWANSLTFKKALGSFIAIGNVVALSLLFTLGLATFLMGVGVAALPALIIGASIAFTAGAFTEFYFYNAFLSKFCDKINDKWEQFKSSPYPVFGFACSLINGTVNGILAYVGIMMITGLLTAAGVALPPLGILMAVAATAAIFAGAASFIMGLDFWISHSRKIVGFFSKNKSSSTEPTQSSSSAVITNTVTAIPSPSSNNNNTVAITQASAPSAPVQNQPTKKTSIFSFFYPSTYSENNIKPLSSHNAFRPTSS